MTTITQVRSLLASTLLLASSTALACTCCGLDDTWRSGSVAPGSYEATVVDQLRLGPGRFRPNVCEGCKDDMEEWSISAVERTADGFVFRSDVGTFRFRSKGGPEYRTVDVTFMTNPNYQLDDDAAIYHEVVFVGTLEVSDQAAKHLGKSTLDATVVLRGRGNQCTETSSFQQWLISSWQDSLILRGSGSMVEWKAGAALPK